MSERSYFSLRYAIPGYTFILVVVGINHAPLLTILPGNGFTVIFGALLAFLSLLSGSAIGFLVSQIWWWRFQKKFGTLGLEEFRETSLKALSETFGLEESQLEGYPKRKLLAVLDYVTHYNADKGVLTLSQRRWDMYHVLSSIFCSLCLAVVAGIVCRIFCEFTVFNGHFSTIFNVTASAETVVLAFLFVIVAFLLFILRKQIKWVKESSAYIHEARIRSCKLRKDDLERAFPDIFPPKTVAPASEKEGV